MSREFESGFFSYTSVIVPWTTQTKTQLSTHSRYSISLNMLNATCSLLTIMINSPTTTSIKVLPVASNGRPMMSETSLSSSMSNTTKLLGR